MRAIVCDNCQKVVEVKEDDCIYMLRITPYSDYSGHIDARKTIRIDLCRECTEKFKKDFNIKEKKE